MDVTAPGCVSVYASGNDLSAVLNRLANDRRPSPAQSAAPAQACEAAVERLLSSVDPAVMRSRNGSPTIRGAALLATPDRCWALSLPMPMATHVTMGERFYLAPLLQIFGPDHVVGLVLSAHGARIVQTFSTWTHTAPLDIDEPAPAASACSPGDGPLASMRPLIRWLSAVDDALGGYLPRRHHPVVCVAPPELAQAYGALHLHRSLIPGDTRTIDTLPENGASLDAGLRQSIQRAAHQHQDQTATDDLHRLHEQSAYAPERCVHDPHVIAREAGSRRVETLFVDASLLVTARPIASGDGAPASSSSSSSGPASSTGAAVPVDAHHPVEQAVARTLVAGGTVHPVRSTRLPAGRHMVALLRY